METTVHAHTNRLIHETSPYLLQHAHNPVDWYSWGPDAMEKARAEEKPIFLSIGYSSCHWCHVMERESFENEETAALMNEHFVCIKVDREERPDIDAIYMEAVHAFSNQAGWPLNMILLPTGEPFYGGSYFPPEPRYGLPSFRMLLRSVIDAWSQRRDQVETQAKQLTQVLQRGASIGAPDGGAGAELSSATLDAALQQLGHYFDAEDGGFGTQPKFPQPMTIDFCLAYYVRTGDLDALAMAEITLQHMARGGIYDQLGGGFHRYSVDAFWLVPHFEKMLYDNAQLLRTYLHAWQLTGEAEYRRVVEETIDYVLREMTSPSGGFYSSQDADSEGHEGRFFVWTPAEIEAALDAESAAIVERFFNVSAHGNFEGRSILHRTRSVEEVAQSLSLPAAEVESSLAAARARLFAVREQRIRPARDEKVIVEWNALMIHALAECGVVLGREDALQAAVNAASFILKQMADAEGRLARTWKDDHTRGEACLEDYAALIRALIALYESTFDLLWLAEASRLMQLVMAEFHDDERGGFFQTGIDHEQLVVRRKDFAENALPSGNSMIAEALQRLSVLFGNDDYRREAARICLALQDAMAQQPTAFGRLLVTLGALLSPSTEIVVVGDLNDAATRSLLAEARRPFLPNAVIAAMAPGSEPILPLFEGRTLVEGRPAGYVCENLACRLPVTDPAELRGLLK